MNHILAGFKTGKDALYVRLSVAVAGREKKKVTHNAVGLFFGFLLSLAFPSVVRPKPVGRFPLDVLFQQVHVLGSELFVFRAAGIVGHELKRAVIVPAAGAGHFSVIYGGIHLLGNALGAGEYGRVLMQEVNYMKLKESDTVDMQIVQEVRQIKGDVSVKLEDRQKAIDWLSKFFLMHPESKYKAEYEKKRAEIKDESAERILENMQTIVEILNQPTQNRSIEDFEEKKDEQTGTV